MLLLTGPKECWFWGERADVCFLRTCLLGPMLSILLYGDPITVASCVGVSWPDAQDRDSCRVGSAVPLALIKNWRKCKFKAILKPTTQGKFGMMEFNFCLLQLGPDHCITCLYFTNYIHGSCCWYASAAEVSVHKSLFPSIGDVIFTASCRALACTNHNQREVLAVA